MKNKFKRFINIFLFLLCVVLTFYVVFKKNDINVIINNVRNADFKYIFLAIICMFVYISGEGINIRRVLTTLGHKVSFFSAFKYASVGFFFSSITPSATGGDPAQLYFMAKDKLPISHSALSLLVELTSFQFIVFLFGTVGVLINYKLLSDVMGGFKYFTLLGLMISILYFAFLLMLIFSKKVVVKIVNFLYRILSKFKYKKKDVFLERTMSYVQEYHKCSGYLKKNKLVLLKVVCTTFVQMFLYFSIPYFVYKSLGLSESGIISFVFLQAALYISVSYIPFPGSMGVSEGGFMIIYKLLFPVHLLSSAMIISRGINFYLFVIFTGFFIATCVVLKWHNEKKRMIIDK